MVKQETQPTALPTTAAPTTTTAAPTTAAPTKETPTTEAPTTPAPTTPAPTTKTEGPTTTTVPTTSITNCDSGWTPFIHTGKCYKYSDQITNRTQALRLCQSANFNPTSTLASIPDMKTNNFLTSVTKESSWTGGYKNSQGEWGWTDGSPWTFTNWNTGEPNNHLNIEDFVEINHGSTGKWNDDPDARSQGALCQYDPRAAQTTKSPTTTKGPVNGN